MTLGYRDNVLLIPLCLFSILLGNSIVIGDFISFLFRCNVAFIMSFSCQLDTCPESPWERTETEELSPYGWPIGMSVRYFCDCWLMEDGPTLSVCGTIPKQVVLGYVRKAIVHETTSKPVSQVPQWLLLQAPALASVEDGLQLVRLNNPSPS